MRSAPNPDALNRLRCARARVSQQRAPMQGALKLLSDQNVKPGTIAVATRLIFDELEWIEELVQASRAAEEAYMRSAVLHVLDKCGSPMLPCNCGESCINLAYLSDVLDELAPGVREEWEKRGPTIA